MSDEESNFNEIPQPDMEIPDAPESVETENDPGEEAPGSTDSRIAELTELIAQQQLVISNLNSKLTAHEADLSQLHGIVNVHQQHIFDADGLRDELTYGDMAVDPDPILIIATIGSTDKQYTQKQIQNGTVGVMPAGLVCSSDTALEAAITLASTEEILMKAFDPVTNVFRRIVVGGGSGSLIPVTLEADGGSAGDLTTQASWTYEVTSGADTLGTGESPLFQRPEFGAMTEGLVGIWDTADEVLVVTDEQPEIGDCEGTIVVSP